MASAPIWGGGVRGLRFFGGGGGTAWRACSSSEDESREMTLRLLVLFIRGAGSFGLESEIWVCGMEVLWGADFNGFVVFVIVIVV